MSKHRVFMSIFLLLLAVGGVSLPVMGAQQAGFDAVNAYIRSEMDELRIPGMAVVVISGDEVVYSQGFGVADAAGRAVNPQTPMLLGSVSKGMTALAVMQLVEAGKLDLDVPVVQYLPWFHMADSPNSGLSDAWAQITPRQLLHQTSGIAEYAGANTWNSRYAGDDALERQVRSFAEFPIVHAPGTIGPHSPSRTGRADGDGPATPTARLPGLPKAGLGRGCCVFGLCTGRSGCAPDDGVPFCRVLWSRCQCSHRAPGT